MYDDLTQPHPRRIFSLRVQDGKQRLLPTRFVLDGDLDRAMDLVPQGTQILNTMRRMNVQDLPQYALSPNLPSGIMIRSSVAFGQETVHIYVPIPSQTSAGTQQQFQTNLVLVYELFTTSDNQGPPPIPSGFYITDVPGWAPVYIELITNPTSTEKVNLTGTLGQTQYQIFELPKIADFDDFYAQYGYAPFTSQSVTVGPVESSTENAINESSPITNICLDPPEIVGTYNYTLVLSEIDSSTSATTSTLVFNSTKIPVTGVSQQSGSSSFVHDIESSITGSEVGELGVCFVTTILTLTTISTEYYKTSGSGILVYSGAINSGGDIYCVLYGILTENTTTPVYPAGPSTGSITTELHANCSGMDFILDIITEPASGGGYFSVPSCRIYNFGGEPVYVFSWNNSDTGVVKYGFVYHGQLSVSAAFTPLPIYLEEIDIYKSMENWNKFGNGYARAAYINKTTQEQTT